MHILLIICFLVITSVQIVYLVAAGTFLFVLIDIPCSVVVLWKMRRKEQDFLSRNFQEQEDDFTQHSPSLSPANFFTDDNASNDNHQNNNHNQCLTPQHDDLSSSSAAASSSSSTIRNPCQNGHSSQQAITSIHSHSHEQSMSHHHSPHYPENSVSSESENSNPVIVHQNNNPCNSNSISAVKEVCAENNERNVCSSSANSTLSTIDKPTLFPSTTSTSTCTSTPESKTQSPPLFHTKDANLHSMDGTAAFREMFPLGACIIVLTIYLITRRKTILGLPLSLPAIGVPASFSNAQKAPAPIPVPGSGSGPGSCQGSCPGTPTTPGTPRSPFSSITRFTFSPARDSTSGVNKNEKKSQSSNKTKYGQGHSHGYEGKGRGHGGPPTKKVNSVLDRFSSVLNKAQQQQQAQAQRPPLNSSYRKHSTADVGPPKVLQLQQNAVKISSMKAMATAPTSSQQSPIPNGPQCHSLLQNENLHFNFKDETPAQTQAENKKILEKESFDKILEDKVEMKVEKAENLITPQITDHIKPEVNKVEVEVMKVEEKEKLPTVIQAEKKIEEIVPKIEEKAAEIVPKLEEKAEEIVPKLEEKEIEKVKVEPEIVPVEKEKVVASDLQREAPVIEILDILKGDNSSRQVRIKSGVVVSERYLIKKEIGRGGFSKVYLGIDQKWNRKVAIKTASRLLNQTKSLKKELAIYEDLQRSSSKLSIPYLIHYTEVDIKRMAILVMELLGPSLEDLFEACDLKFSRGTVCVIMEQMLDILSYFHGKTYIHRDIKPENILVGQMGTPDAARIYLIDFGVVTNWCSTVTGKHLKLEYGHSKAGTNSYMSINSHKGKTNSRKDDLEALGYCMMRFLKVTFPWTRYDDMAVGIKEVVTAKLKAEMNFEEEFPLSEFPKEIPGYMQYVRDLPFDAEPDYEMLKKSFRDLNQRLKVEEGWDGLEWLKPDITKKLPEWSLYD